MPPVGTKPGIERQRASQLEWASRLGLEFLRLHRGVLPYATPPFERNALERAGLGDVAADWRRGDLALFISRSPGRTGRPAAPPRERRDEEAVLGVRLR